MLRLVSIDADMDFLEVGCGGGAVSSHLADTHHMTVTGVDIDSDMFMAAHRKSTGAPNLRFVEADATRLPFGSQSFDIVLSFGVMHHISNWQNALKEIARVMRPHGHFILFDIVIPGYATKIFRRMAKKYGCYDVDDIVSLLRSQDLNIIHMDAKGHLSMGSFGLVAEKKSD